jgi:hypothetical protein
MERGPSLEADSRSDKQNFYDTKDSFPCSQEQIIGRYLKPHESSPYHYISLRLNQV